MAAPPPRARRAPAPVPGRHPHPFTWLRPAAESSYLIRGDLRPFTAGRPNLDHRQSRLQAARLLLRARNKVAPMRFAGLLGIPVGLVDVYEGGGMLRGIRAWAI